MQINSSGASAFHVSRDAASQPPFAACWNAAENIEAGVDAVWRGIFKDL